MSGFRNVILSKLIVANSIVNSAGMFFYSGTPAAGNLIASVGVAAAGTDQFGNAFVDGDAVYASSDTIFAQLHNGVLVLRNKNVNAIGAILSANNAGTVQLASPFETVADTAAILNLLSKAASTTGAPMIQAQADVDVANVGSGLRVAEGANAKQGTAILVGGTKTVANTSVTLNSKISHWRQVAGGTLGHLSIGTIIAGTSFVINSTSNLETSTIGYQIFEPG